MAKRRRKHPGHEAVAPLPDDETLQAQRDMFRRKFGSDPGPDDPVFVYHDAAGPRPMTEAEIDAAVMVAMHRAGARPELIHAYRRCRFLLTEERLPVSTEEERAAWMAAIDEYREYHARRN
jgi:hypothetical protein